MIWRLLDHMLTPVQIWINVRYGYSERLDAVCAFVFRKAYQPKRALGKVNK